MHVQYEAKTRSTRASTRGRGQGRAASICHQLGATGSVSNMLCCVMQEHFRNLGESVLQTKLDLMKAQMASFKSRLEEFAINHRCFGSHNFDTSPSYLVCSGNRQAIQRRGSGALHDRQTLQGRDSKGSHFSSAVSHYVRKYWSGSSSQQ